MRIVSSMLSSSSSSSLSTSSSPSLSSSHDTLPDGSQISSCLQSGDMRVRCTNDLYLALSTALLSLTKSVIARCSLSDRVTKRPRIECTESSSVNQERLHEWTMNATALQNALNGLGIGHVVTTAKMSATEPPPTTPPPIVLNPLFF